MQIKALSRATGVDAETIRFYEKEGLLPAPPRLDNGYRHYGPPHVERLAFVRHCRALDMPLPDVRRLLAYLDDTPAHCGDVNDLIDAQLIRVQARLHSMRALEKQLLTLRAQCQGTGPACGILTELVAAAHGEACACHEDVNQA
jgi:DNA-binding transcriptional MerR regulator